MCPVAMMHSHPEIRQLIDTHEQFDLAGIEMFKGRVPAWVVDFKAIINGADLQREGAIQELKARQ